MDTRTKRIFIISGIVFGVGIIALLLFYFLTPKLPSTQDADKTVVIDNYTDYTSHISPDSFGYLGNYLYTFIKNPSEGVYHATIVNDSYRYSPDSWFSTFTVNLVNSDVSWKISMQTIKDGEINGDISVTCDTGGSNCLSLSNKVNSTTKLQDLLPLNSDDYIITYQKDKYNALSVVYYDQAGTGKAKAIEKIKSLGFNPDDYTIEYFYGGH